MSPGPRAAAVRAALRGGAPANAFVRDMIRRYCREHGKPLVCLAPAWRCKTLSVWRVFGRRRPLLPRQVEGVIALFHLDEFDANDLRLRAAREAGWNIDPSMLLQGDA